MCAHLCVCTSVCVCTCVQSLYIPEHVSVRVYVRTYASGLTHVCLPVRVCAWACACLYLWPPACTCACLGEVFPPWRRSSWRALVPGSPEPSSSRLSLSSQTSCGAWKGTSVPPWHSRPQPGLNLPPHSTPSCPAPQILFSPHPLTFHAAPCPSDCVFTGCQAPLLKGAFSLAPMVPFKDNICPHFAVGDTEVQRGRMIGPRPQTAEREPVARFVNSSACCLLFFYSFPLDFRKASRE